MEVNWNAIVFVDTPASITKIERSRFAKQAFN